MWFQNKTLRLRAVLPKPAQSVCGKGRRNFSFKYWLRPSLLPLGFHLLSCSLSLPFSINIFYVFFIYFVRRLLAFWFSHLVFLCKLQISFMFSCFSLYKCMSVCHPTFPPHICHVTSVFLNLPQFLSSFLFFFFSPITLILVKATGAETLRKSGSCVSESGQQLKVWWRNRTSYYRCLQTWHLVCCLRRESVRFQRGLSKSFCPSINVVYSMYIQ